MLSHNPTAPGSTTNDHGGTQVGWTSGIARTPTEFSLTPALSGRPTTNEPDRPEALSPTSIRRAGMSRGAVNRKGQLQSEVDPQWTRASARYSRCRRRARRPGQRRGARTTHRSVVPFERARVPRGPPSTAHFKKATGKPRREPHTREHVQRICSWPDRSSSTSAARREVALRLPEGRRAESLCTRRP